MPLYASFWEILWCAFAQFVNFSGAVCPQSGTLLGACLEEMQPLKRTFSGQMTPFKRTFGGSAVPLNRTFAFISRTFPPSRFSSAVSAVTFAILLHNDHIVNPGAPDRVPGSPQEEAAK